MVSMNKRLTYFYSLLIGMTVIFSAMIGCKTKQSDTSLTANEIYLIGKEHTQFYWESLNKNDLANAKHHYSQVIRRIPKLHPRMLVWAGYISTLFTGGPKNS